MSFNIRFSVVCTPNTALADISCCFMKSAGPDFLTATFCPSGQAARMCLSMRAATSTSSVTDL